MRKFIASCAVVLIAFTIAAGEEVTGIITKVDGNKVTFKKGGFGKKKDGDKAEEVTLNAEGAKVVNGKVSFADKKLQVEAGEAYEGGLKKLGEAAAEAAKKAGEKKDDPDKKGKKGFGGFPGVFAQIITDKDISDKGAKITEIRVIQFGGKKKKDAE